jgi:PIN domain nuclease of toxin-antitoxin system
MRLLLDSHVVLWLFTVDPDRPPKSIDAVVDDANEVLVSAATFWEVEVKRLKGKLSAPPNLLDHVEDAGFRLLDITAEQLLDAARLPRHHGDPFDRILVAQAQGEAATLVTDDGTLERYDVPLIRVGTSAG